jgi:heterodisulfide reductase subunit A-like polyferredoxin
MSEESLPEEKGKKLEDIRKEAEEKACPVQKALYYIEEFISGPMCGRCFPCALGTGEARIRLIRISQHSENVSKKDIEALKRVGSRMIEASFCKKGKDVGKFLVETISAADEAFMQHISGICPNRECKNLIEYVINPELCNMCGKCSEVCKYDAIIGEKKNRYRSGYLPFEIRRKRCTRCGECIKVCPTGAVEIVAAFADELVGKG